MLLEAQNWTQVCLCVCDIYKYLLGRDWSGYRTNKPLQRHSYKKLRAFSYILLRMSSTLNAYFKYKTVALFLQFFYQSNNPNLEDHFQHYKLLMGNSATGKTGNCDLCCRLKCNRKSQRFCNVSR